jgi:anti-sigma B factor antagonist
VSLSLENRRVGDVAVVTCHGRIIDGPESVALQKQLEELIPINPHIVLHLGDVSFIDSAGLGLLVRFLTRAQNARGSLKFCGVSQKVGDVLKVTRLHSIFPHYETEAEAIAAAYRVHRTKEMGFLEANVLCVDKSADVLAYLRELLKGAGHSVITAANLPDALILLTATQPKVVVVGAELRAITGTRAAEEFRKLADARRLVVLPADFSHHDAGEAGQQLLDQVAASLSPGQAPTTSAS